jgi:hypothetical protein
MKKLMAVLFLTTILGLAVQAQEEPIPPRRPKAAKMGLFAGITPSYLFVNTKDLNAALAPTGAAPLSEDGVFMYGGGGAIYIMVIPNVRVGGVGMSGSLSSSTITGGIRKDVDMHVGYGGVTFEYVITIVPRLDVALGTMIGWGGVDLTLTEDAGGNKSFSQEVTSFGSGNYLATGTQVANIERNLSGSYWILNPSVNVEYALLGWLGVRLGASYVSMFSPSWDLDGQYNLSDVPSGITGNGWMINGGIFLGTF